MLTIKNMKFKSRVTKFTGDRRVIEVPRAIREETKIGDAVYVESITNDVKPFKPLEVKTPEEIRKQKAINILKSIEQFEKEHKEKMKKIFEKKKPMEE